MNLNVLVPENTLESTALAAIELADHVELDLTLSADGVLMVYHDLTLRASSNIASLPQFADRVRNFTGVIDENGNEQTIRNNWMFNDLTKEELQSLGVVQRGVGIRPRLFDGNLKIPTFAEFLSQVHHMAYGLNRSMGLVVELKNPYYYNTYQNISVNPRFMENLVLATLAQFGYPLTSEDTPRCVSDQDGNAPVPCGHLVIQSFELPSMQHLHQVAPFIEKSMLINAGLLPLLTFQGIQDLSGWISYFSPWKELVYTGILAQIEAEGIQYNETMIDEMGGFVPPQ
ncbi:glycerophosphodiester phosphodiesterase GDPD5 [Folsomia candida]|uniref:glycerophosphodiester phosphodiesterase GDPD5 n=1 Tax=Folsomia candida TaxID=158441 RepID=UPI0016055034|nr:glycerophosphodiester phosphodiesterase GDPD5 [Folsomia candida]